MSGDMDKIMVYLIVCHDRDKSQYSTFSEKSIVKPFVNKITRW